jgi:hypothetical protein
MIRPQCCTGAMKHFWARPNRSVHASLLPLGIAHQVPLCKNVAPTSLILEAACLCLLGSFLPKIVSSPEKNVTVSLNMLGGDKWITFIQSARSEGC